MKKIYIYLLTIFITASFTGCFDLDQYPYDKPSSQTFWKTEDQAKMGIMGVYSRMKTRNALGLIFMTDALTDIGLGFDNVGYQPLIIGTYTDRTNEVVNKWQSTYDAIMAANDVIRNVSQAEISEDVKEVILAEAKFLRGLFYFHLLDYFGGVPIYDESVVLETDYNDLLKPRANAEATTDFILQDLNDAVEGLPVSWASGDYGRATKGAAYALRGKVYLYANNYENAISDFEEIVEDNATYGYALYPDYAQLFKPQADGGADTSSEIIFAIQNKGGIGMNYGMPMTFYMGTRSSFGSCWNNSMPSVTLADMYELKDGRPFNWNDFIPGFNEDKTVKTETFLATLTENLTAVAEYPIYHQQLVDMYEQRDPRMGQTLIVPYSDYLGWIANAPKPSLFVPANGAHESNGFLRNNRAGWYTYFWRKFVAEANMNGLITNREHSPINFPLIRYADVLLMLAECYNEMDRYDEAVNYINEVRQRPSTDLPALNSGPAWLSATTKQEIFERIVQERAVELAGEGIRFSDIRRWRMAESLLSDKQELGLTGDPLLNRKFGPRDYLWPIPAVEREINPDLTQNPSWE